MASDRMYKNAQELSYTPNGLYPLTISRRFNETFYQQLRSKHGDVLFTLDYNERLVEFDGNTGIVSREYRYRKNSHKTYKTYTYSLINRYGFRMAPMIYTSYKRVNNEYTLLKSSKLYGLLDADLQELVKPQYESIDLVDGILIKVYGGGQIGYFDIRTRNWIWELKG